MHKVIELKDFKITGINNKYTIAKGKRTLILSAKYRGFKRILSLCCRKVKVEKPYCVYIEMNSYFDIDAAIKCILDSLGNCLEDDRYINHLEVLKRPIKRGGVDSLTVWVGHYTEEKK